VTLITTPDSMPWDTLRDAMRPAANRPANWDLAWDVMVATYGNTAGDCARWMADACRLLHERHGDRDSDPRPNINAYLLDLLDHIDAEVEARIILADTGEPVGAIVSLVDATASPSTAPLRAAMAWRG
jgi:hypothetical protein